MKGVYTRLSFRTCTLALVFLGFFLVMPITQTIAETCDEPASELIIEYTAVLGYENYDYVYTTEEFSKNYGFRYSYSTSPSSTIQVWAFPYDDLYEWSNNLYCDEHQLDTGSSGSGSWRFTSTDTWTLAVWNIGYSTTTITYTVTVEDMGSPYSPGTGSFPWGIVIGIIGTIVCIGGVIFLAVRRSRKKQQVPVYHTTQPTFQNTSPFQQQIGYSQQTNLDLLTKKAMLEMSKGNISGAISYWNQTLRISPNFYPALAGLGLIFFSSGQFDIAITYLSRAQTLNPTNPEINGLLGEARAMSILQSSDFTSQPFTTTTEESSTETTPEISFDKVSADEQTEKQNDGEKMCSDCGAELTAEDEFCPFCGSKVD